MMILSHCHSGVMKMENFKRKFHSAFLLPHILSHSHFIHLLSPIRNHTIKHPFKAFFCENPNEENGKQKKEKSSK